MKIKPIKQQGFTLIEVVLAVSLSGIVVLGVGSMLTSLWQRSFNFITEKLTMDDVELAATIFEDKVRTCTSIHTDLSYIMFDSDGGTSSLSIDSENKKLVFDPDTHNEGEEMDLLTGAAVSFNALAVGNSTLYTMTISVDEVEVNKTNVFTFSAMARDL